LRRAQLGVVRHAGKKLVVDLAVEPRPLCARRVAQPVGELALDQIVLAQLLIAARIVGARPGAQPRREPRDVL
jgi:hypothetical protein